MFKTKPNEAAPIQELLQKTLAVRCPLKQGLACEACDNCARQREPIQSNHQRAIPITVGAVEERTCSSGRA